MTTNYTPAANRDEWNAAWERRMVDAGWTPQRDVFGGITSWSTKSGRLVQGVNVSVWRDLGITPPPL